MPYGAEFKTRAFPISKERQLLETLGSREEGKKGRKKNYLLVSCHGKE